MNLVPFLLDAVRGAIILGLALAALPLARRAPAEIRRALLLSALLGALAVPLAARMFAAAKAAPVVTLPFFVRQIHSDPVVEPNETPPLVTGSAVGRAAGEPPSRVPEQPVVFAWPALVMLAWSMGAAVVALRLGLGILRARRLVRNAQRDAARPFEPVARAVIGEIGVRADVAISDEIDAPAVAGVFRPVVLMPRSALAWTRQMWRLVLLHELAHVARRDCLATVMAQLACATHWFNPLVWVTRQRFRRERELAADEDVLAAGNLATEYAAHLLTIATGSRTIEAAGALGMTARPSDLAHRVERLVAPGRPSPASRGRVAAIAVAVSAMTLAVACANARPGSPAVAAEARIPEATVNGGSMTTAETARAAAPQEQSTEHPSRAPTVSASGSSLVEEVAKQLGAHATRVELTIVPALQGIVDEELARLAAEHQPEAATALVLDPGKGEILAIGDAATARRAFVTGSTIKPLTVAAALEAGAVRIDQQLDCRTRSIGARTIQDPKERALLDVGAIVEVSSNVGASRIFDATGKERFDEVLARFHLGDASTVELPGVSRGEVPKTARLDAYDAAMVAIGEGLTATPLQMAAAYGAFANRGEYVAPTLVRKIADDRGGAAPARAVSRERVVRGETAQAIMQMLERAVNGDQATGKRAKVKGVRVAGKTGTAGWTAPDGKEHLYASFVGIVPADSPRYVILVGALDPRGEGWGPVVAAPAFAKIAARALSVQ